MEYRTLTEASAGDKIEFLGKKNGWYRVRVNGVEGYLSSGFVSSQPSASTSSSTASVSREERRRSRRRVASSSRHSGSASTVKKHEPEAAEPPQFVP